MLNKSNNTIIDEGDIRYFIKMFVSNWYIFVVLVIVAVLISRFRIHRATNIYAASTTVLIKNLENEGMKSSILRGLGINQGYHVMENEAEVIKSSPMIREALSKLNFEVSYFIKGRLRTSFLYKSEPFEVDVKAINPNYNNLPFYLNIIDANKFKLHIVEEGYKYDKVHFFDELIVNDHFTLLIKKDATFFRGLIDNPNREEINYFFKINDITSLVNKYRSNLTVTKYDWPAAYITVNLNDEIPQRAIDFLDTLAKVYIKNSVQSLADINNKALLFIDDQLAEIVSELNKTELSLESYKTDKVVYSVQNESVMYLDKMNKLISLKSELEMKSNSLDYLLKTITENSADLAFTPSVVDDVFLSNTLKELTDLIKEKDNVLQQVTTTSPIYKDYNIRIDKLKSDLVKHIKITKESVQNKINTVNKEISMYRQMVRNIPKKERELINIKRKLAINEKIYVYLLEKRAETVIAKASIISDKTVLEPASSLGIVSPDRRKIYFTNIGISLVISLLLIFIRQTFFNTIDSKEDLEHLSDLPIIGVIGKSKLAKDSPIVSEKYPKSQIAESFRAIRTSLDYMASNIDHKVVLLTSCFPSEGKTFCSINLATLIAKANKKVLLIDLDLHKPRLGTPFDISHNYGVTSYLVGQRSFSEIVNETHIENLHAISSGSIPPNASDLILSPELDKLISEAKKKYEYIILDTPPIGLLSDAKVLVRKCDINFFVLKAGYARKKFVELAHEIIEQNKPKNFSFILNNVKSRMYTSGYGYGYGYGGDSDDIYEED